MNEVPKKFVRVEFGCYTDNVTRKISVLEITNQKTFDELGHATVCGLYDRRLGMYITVIMIYVNNLPVTLPICYLHLLLFLTSQEDVMIIIVVVIIIIIIIIIVKLTFFLSQVRRCAGSFVDN